MSRGDYQTFTLDLTDTGCIDEVIEALLQKCRDKYDEKIEELKEAIVTLELDAKMYQEEIDAKCARIIELEAEIVNQRTGMYEL